MASQQKTTNARQVYTGEPKSEGPSFEDTIAKQLHVSSDLIDFCTGSAYARDALVNTSHTDRVIRNAVRRINKEIKIRRKKKLYRRLNRYCKRVRLDIPSLVRAIQSSNDTLTQPPSNSSFNNVSNTRQLISYIMTKYNSSNRGNDALNNTLNKYPLKPEAERLFRIIMEKNRRVDALANGEVTRTGGETKTRRTAQTTNPLLTTPDSPSASPKGKSKASLGSARRQLFGLSRGVSGNNKFIDLSFIKMQKDPEAVEAMKRDDSYTQDFQKIQDTYLNPTNDRVDKIVKSVVQESTNKDPYFLMSPPLKTAVKQCWMDVTRKHPGPVLKLWFNRDYRDLATLPKHTQEAFFNLVAAKLNCPNENRQYTSTNGGMMLQQAYRKALTMFFDALRNHHKRRRTY